MWYAKGGEVLALNNEIPLSLFRSGDATVVYFNLGEVIEPEWVERAYLVVDTGSRETRDITVSINDRINFERDAFITGYSRFSGDVGNCVNIDITREWHLMVSGTLPNNGLMLRMSSRHINYGRLRLVYNREVIAPADQITGFYEKELYISGRGNRSSPWFLTENSSVITYFVNNLGCDEILIHIENSPNTRETVTDAGRLILCPGETGALTPFLFSKYQRLSFCSHEHPIAARIWFQTRVSV